LLKQDFLADNNTLVRLVSLDIADRARHPDFYLSLAFAEGAGILGADIKTAARALGALL
jgi:hypothetical protein